MLDAFIIERIRRERERRDAPRVPLQIEIPCPLEAEEVPGSDDPQAPERGSTLVDDTV